MNRIDNAPARFCGSTSSKCEKVCVEVKRIFDACIQRRSIENVQLTVCFPQCPRNLVVKCVNSVGKAIISNLSITPIPRSIFSRVRFTVTIPIQVVAMDNAGNIVYGTSSYSECKDIMLRVPASTALAPIQVDASVSIVGLNNTLSDSVLTTTLCVTIITKVYAKVILSIPSYGYPFIPPCKEFEEDLCSEVFNKPLYPRGDVLFGCDD